jgi:hypothetical protein
VFTELGFVPQTENLWTKFSEEGLNVPHFVMTTTVNPKSLCFIVKNLIENKTLTTDSYEDIVEFILKGKREQKIKKLLD